MTQLWYAGLAISMRKEHDYSPRMEGDLPSGLQGTLYRNGPGRYELGCTKMTHLLDSDDMLQVFNFFDSQLRYRNRFVRTQKFLTEEKTGLFSLPGQRALLADF